MASLIPLPTTRVSNLLIRERLLSQLQGDQLDIFRLQSQVSTGRRFTLPSEDPAAAQKAMTLQRLIERKTQLRSSVASGKLVLGAADTALNDVAATLGGVRGQVLGASSTTASEEERRTAIAAVNGAIKSLVEIGNKNFGGRYLFTGSQLNVKPYEVVDGYVRYNGNEKSVNSYSDIDVLFSTNAAGTEVFGGISGQVVGGASLNPEASANTPLSSLRGGRGVSANGAIRISDGTNASIVDVSRATTLGDIARLIEENPPAGRTVTVNITATGLSLGLDSSGGGLLSVSEVGTGRTASELGLLNSSGVTPPALLVGQDVDPAVLKTTRIADLLGSKARARLSSPGVDNDLLLEAAVNGSTYNGATIQLVDDELLTADNGLVAGSERVEYDASARPASASLSFSGAGDDLLLTAAAAGTAFNNVEIVVAGATGIGDTATVAYNSTNRRLTITVDDAGATTVQTVLDAINDEGTFIAAHDASVESALAPTDTIAIADIGAISGNTGNSGGAAGTLYIFVDEGKSTAAQIAAAINAEGTFTATFDLADSDTASAAGKGTINVDATATASGGSGGVFDAHAGIRVVNGGKTHTIAFENAETVEDLLNILNSSEAGLYAEINADLSGINVRSRTSGSDFQIGENGGTTAAQLGIRSFTGATRLAGLNYGVGVPVNNGTEATINSAMIRLTSRDGQTFDVDLSTATTPAHVIAAINAVTGANVTAQPGANGGVKLVDNTIGAAGLSITQSGAALGIAGGVHADVPARDFSVTARDGTAFNVDVSGLGDIDDVIAAINAAAGGAVTARIASVGNGIELIDNTAGAGALTVTSAENSQAAEYLGLVPKGSPTASSSTGTLTGADRNYLQTDSVFSTLIRLRSALEANDTEAINRGLAAIDVDIDRVAFARSDIGARERALDLSARSLEDEDVTLQSALSEAIDVDLIEAISNLVARQSSLQASLQASATILKLSLLDFL